MRIPVFVSCPTSLSDEQQRRRRVVQRELDRHNLEARALGRSDYPTECPLREVYSVAKHCSGGVVLGFGQLRAPAAIVKGGTPAEKRLRGPVVFPTPWNHLEAGVLFSLGLPLLVFAEDGVAGGIFDPGVTDVFVHRMPGVTLSRLAARELKAVFQKWQASVRAHYYR
jgi:hypothetical protein